MHDVQTSPLPKWLRSSAVAWGGALLSVLVVILTVGFLSHEKQAMEDRELQSAELYARVLQDHGDRTFNTIEIAMGALNDAIGSEASANDTSHLDRDLSSALNGLPFMRSLSLITADGLVIASSSPANIGVEVETAHLKLPREGVVDALGSSVSGRDLSDLRKGRAAPSASSRTFVPLVRPVGKVSGARLYMVAVLNSDFFGNAYELTLADSTRGAGIFSIDAVMLAGTSNLLMAPGQNVKDHVFFTAFLPSRESGSCACAGIDGTKVVTAFRSLRNRPLVIIVERNDAYLQAAFHKTLFWTLGICACALALIGALMLMGWRSLKSSEAASEALEATRMGVAASERDLRVLVESVHEWIFRADADGRIVFVNGRWLELTQRPASDVLGKRMTDLCREDERTMCRTLFNADGTEDETMLVRVEHASGKPLTLELSVSRVQDAHGNRIGFAGFAVDVTAREAAKQALESQLHFTAQLLEVSPTPIFVKDEQGRFLMANRAWLELMNLGVADVVGRSSADLFGHSALMHTEQDHRLLESEQRVHYESRLLVENRPSRDTLVTKVRFMRADGTAAGIVGSIVDVTEFREAERTVRQARDTAESANSAKSEFIANISHELRTPLQGIIGFSEIGRDLSGALPDVFDMFTDIHASGLRMLTLVNGLLDVSQMESVVGSLPLRRADIARLVREAAGQLLPQSVVRDLKFNLAGLDEAIECDVDCVRFQQAVRNVLSNAVRYSPVGGVIDVSLSDGGSSGVELCVRDHGPGIPDAELELIFEAFVQSSRTRDGSGGTGLGLTITRKIVSAHGGSVVAANAEGGGALIRLSFPAAGMLTNARGGLSWQDSDGLLFASEVN